jgi:secreted PhoX family phosphatase
MDVKEKKPEDREFPKSALNPDGTFCIPDNLRLLPTDTDAEKDKKRRKVKVPRLTSFAGENAAPNPHEYSLVEQSLKSRYKQMQKQQDTTSKQSSWQAFAGSTGKKRVKGSFAGVRKESIFKTPDNLEGRVGVVGSGKGVTEFEAKKRYKMNL